MPYSNVPKSMTAKMDRCVQRVMADGKDKKAAVAICYDSVVNKSVQKAADSRKGG